MKHGPRKMQPQGTYSCGRIVVRDKTLCCVPTVAEVDPLPTTTQVIESSAAKKQNKNTHTHTKQHMGKCKIIVVLLSLETQGEFWERAPAEFEDDEKILLMACSRGRCSKRAQHVRGRPTGTSSKPDVHTRKAVRKGSAHELNSF